MNTPGGTTEDADFARGFPRWQDNEPKHYGVRLMRDVMGSTPGNIKTAMINR